MAVPPTLRSFDLNLLVLFDALHRERKLATAASLVGLSQPGASQALARLRDAFDDPLFVRHGALMEPTPLANTLAPAVRDALQCLERGMNAVRTFSPESSEREFRVGLAELGEVVILPKIIARVAALAPSVRIRSIRGARRELELLAISGGVELSVDFEPPAEPSLHYELITEEELVVIARKGHPRVQSELSVQQFLDERHAVVDLPPAVRKRIEQTLNVPFLPQLKRACACAHYSSLPAVVLETDAIATVPRPLVENALYEGRLQTFPLPFPGIRLPVFVSWHESLDADAGHVWLRSLLVRQFWRE